jgi:ABC-type transport system substrate-binding protein
MSKKWLTLTVVLVAFAFILAACGGDAEPEVVEVTRIVTETVTEVVEVEGEPQVVEVEVTRVVVEEVEVEPEEEMVEAGAPSDVYRIALFEDPVSLNYWNYFGPGSSVWTSYVVGGQAGFLYNLSDQRFDFVPELAVDLPPAPVQEGGFWTITVEMVDNAVWSDGEPITAHDVAFTLKEACLDLRLSQQWVDQCKPHILESVEAVDDYTVKFTFKESPGLGDWQAGVALAPVLPEHFWGDAVTEAAAFVEGLEEPVAPEAVEDCTAEELSAADAATCEPYLAEQDAYDEAFENARVTMYEADPTGAPVAGGYTTDTWEPGAFVQRTSNDNYYLGGAQVIEYDDGTYILNTVDGRQLQIYGDAAGEEILNFVKGPYVENVVFTLYGDQSAAFLAMADGDVDYVLNPLSIARGLREQATSSPDVRTIVNDDYGMFYLAFNMRKAPFGDPAFRNAVYALIDKEFVAESVLQGSVFPMYSTMPPGNGAWYADVPTPYVGMERGDRLNAAIKRIPPPKTWLMVKDCEVPTAN